MLYVNFIQLTKIRFVTSWFSQRIWVERQVNIIHRFQKKNFFINANSRSFSLIHDTSSESEMQSSSSKREFESTIFFWLAYFYEWFDDFLLTCVFLQMIWRFSLTTRVSLRAYLAILFCLFAYFDEQSTRDREFDRVSVSLAELRARNFAVLKTWRWSRHRHCSW